MGEKYKLQLLTNNNEVRNTMFTNKPEITIGSSLHTDIRVQQPSVEDSHIQVYFDHMRIRVLGNNVFLNENILERGSVYSFQFGDVVRINKHKFMFSLTEPNDLVEENKIIRQPTMELKSVGESRERVSSMGEVQGQENVDDAIVAAALSNEGEVHVKTGDMDPCAVKQVIEEKKEELAQEIKDSINQLSTDTPVLPSFGKKEVKDLGSAVIEKEMLETASRVVSEKMQREDEVIENCLDTLKQDVKDNIKEELRCDLKQEFMCDVLEDIRDEVKEVLREGDIKDAIVADVMSQIETGREKAKERAEERPGEEEEESEKGKEEELEEKVPEAGRRRRRASSIGMMGMGRRAEGEEEREGEVGGLKGRTSVSKKRGGTEEETPTKKRKTASSKGGRTVRSAAVGTAKSPGPKRRSAAKK